jgi:hypothetical protein
MRRGGERGQTTTETLMISGLVTAIAVFVLQGVGGAPGLRAGLNALFQRLVECTVNNPFMGC